MKFAFAIVLCFCLSNIIRTVLSQQEIGDSCFTATREKGTCMLQTDCVERENVSHHNEFETCKLNADGTPVICCVPKSTTKRDFRFGGGISEGGIGGSSNDVTSSDSNTETKFYNGPKKKPYPKQPNKLTTGKGGHHETQTTFNTVGTHRKPPSPSFGDYDSYSQPSSNFDSFGNFHLSAPSSTADSYNYYDQSSSSRTDYNSQSPATNYNGGSSSKGAGSSDHSYTQSSPSSGNGRNRPPPVAIDGFANNHRQGGAYGDSGAFSTNSGTTGVRGSNNKNSETRHSNRNTNKGSSGYDNGGYNSNSHDAHSRPSVNSNNRYPNENAGNSGESVHYPSTGHQQRPSNGYLGGGGGDGGGDTIYYPDQGGSNHGSQNRPVGGGAGSSSTLQNNGFWPNNGGFGNENGWSNPNPNRQPTTRRPSMSNEEPIWGTTASSTTRRIPSGQRPTGSSQQQKRISEQKCSDYSRIVTSTISAIPLAINGQATTHKVTDCHLQATSLIVGGTKANLGEFPHMVALGFRSGSSITFNCGGTLISEEYVLTAAHCTHSSLGNPVVVRLGDLNLERDDDGAQPLTVNVASVTVHPNYKPPQIYHDIALIKLARRISFNKNLRPACLQIKREVYAGKVVATGWGSTNYGEISSDDLLKVALDIIEGNQCNMLYGPDQKFPKGITSSIMCAGELSGKKDTCQGDSGGPLQIQDSSNKCVYYVIGITSSGKSCGVQNSPGIYTRVSEYIPWIESIVWRS